MKKPRVLVIGEAANPALTSAALVGWSHYLAIAKVADAHLVAEKRNEEEILKAGLPREQFTSINARAAQGLAWKIARCCGAERISAGPLIRRFTRWLTPSSSGNSGASLATA